MKAVVFTLGCKVNEVESSSFIAALESWGAEVSEQLSPADIYVLNTCAVTREAEKKSRQLISRARKFNPDALVYVCGCASQKDEKAFKDKGVTYVCGAQGKAAMLCELAKLFGREYPLNTACDNLPAPKNSRTRAFVKIEDGCNNFCSYCVIPYLRGRVKSRPREEVVAEVFAADSPEVVLTGINISAYRCEAGGLDALLASLSGTDARIRLGSVECTVVDEKFLAACKNLKNFAPQFHLSLQSGSTAVLKSMNRRYTREQYLEKCGLIYKFFPEAAITTDIIAGFPAETEEDFEESLSIISEARLARVHAFAFSPREGTAAYKMKDLPPEVKSERLKRLIAEGEKAAYRFIDSQLPLPQQVVWEEFDGKYTCGYTGGYIRAYAEGDFTGKVTNARLTGHFRDGAIAEIEED
ncbi:MAG: MiaB/RimO family radical SAM methylthiotransferase [Clostridia bacterium]|nr:MiaB/RimO family radical SAM methylthiotransferase [Clostridia bacterium]